MKIFHVETGCHLYGGALQVQYLMQGLARLGHRNADAMRLAIAGPLWRVRRRWPFDVIHAHILVPDGSAGARVGAAPGVPAVPTAHRHGPGGAGPGCPRRSAAPHTSSSRQKLRGDRVCFAQQRVPAWASPFAQVPRPEHMRRRTDDAAPSRRRRYAIRRILLTDSVAYAPRGRIGRKLGCAGVILR